MEPHNHNFPTGKEDLEEVKDSIIDDDISDEADSIDEDASDETDSGEQPSIEQSLGIIANLDENSSSEDDALLELGKESQTELFESGIKAVEKHFGIDAAEHVKSGLARIDDIEKRTIRALEGTEAMTSYVKRLVHTLSTYGVDAGNLTIAEAQAVRDFATDATEEIVNEKVRSIHDAIVHHIEGVRSRHDGAEPAFYSPREIAKKQKIAEKFVTWDRGECDTERGFDAKAVYERLIREGCEPSRFLRRHLEEEDFETLYDEGLVDEDDQYVYGPFTAGDLEDIEIFTASTWTSITNPRYMGGRKRVKRKVIGPDGKPRLVADGEIDRSGAGLSSLIGRTITQNQHSSLEDDLLYDFIAREVLQSRRLEAKDLLTVSTALTLDFLESDDAKEALSSDDKKERDDIRRTISWLAYYTGKILGYSAEELKGRFGSTRPISKEFFDEAAEVIGNLSEERAAYLDESFRPILTKMDEHIHDLQGHLAAASSDQYDSLFSEDLD